MENEKLNNSLKKISKLLLEKFGKDDFSAYDIIPYVDCEPDEDYKPSLEMFRYVFSLGEEGKLFLWDKYCFWISSEWQKDSVEKNKDFTKEEKQFFREIYQHNIDNPNSSVPGNINKDIELVNLLIEHGADVNAKESSGRSVLGYAKATTFDNTEIINILIQAGAKE